MYVDKTEHAYNLISRGQCYFLARPRRFGKSLFVSMLKELFKGNRSLFQGLWIDSSNYSWKIHAVIDIDLSGLGIKDVDSFNKGICARLQEIADEYALNINLLETGPEISLRKLVTSLYKKIGSVAVLIDEYDNPILQALKHIDKATEIRDALKHFFSTIKALDNEIDFVFITGISSFNKAGVFSGMNNLQIISFDQRYAAICGYTGPEIQNNFATFIEDWSVTQHITYDNLCSEIKTWYNGYRFSKSETAVYNPFSLMHALSAQEMKNFWFSSGTPSFLVQLMKKDHRALEPEGFENIEMSEYALGVIDINAMPLPVLLFQTGYLTITDYDPNGPVYKLNYPNTEVKNSFQKYLLEALLRVDSPFVEKMSRHFKAALQKKDMKDLRDILLQLFSHIPYQLHMKEEKYYHSLLIMLCIASDIEVSSEYSTSDGRIDLVLHLQTIIYVAEIKFNKSPAFALAQIKERGYYKPFLSSDKQIVLLGVSFTREPHHFDIKIDQEQLV